MQGCCHACFLGAADRTTPRTAAGVLLHAHRWRWQPHAWLLQVSRTGFQDCCLSLAQIQASCEQTWSCRAFLPPRLEAGKAKENTNLRYPQVLCIISTFLWLPFFHKVNADQFCAVNSRHELLRSTHG